MIRLSVDTSFEHLGVCLTSNGVCLANYYSLCNRKNSSIIFGVIDELLKNAEIKLADIDAYVVNRGPGSYTGVRIAMGVVKTFAQVHQKPVVPVDSLELLAGQISSLKEDFPVLLNCTRSEVFTLDTALLMEYLKHERRFNLRVLKCFWIPQEIKRLSFIE